MTTTGRLVGMAEIRVLLGGVSRRRAYQLTKRPGFPDPIDDLFTGRIWQASEVKEWIRRTRPHQCPPPE